MTSDSTIPCSHGNANSGESRHSEPHPTVRDSVERYLQTGDSDPLYSAWPGSVLERANRGHHDLRHALIAEVRQRDVCVPEQGALTARPEALTRSRVEPMIRGLFPRAEQDVVLAAVERSVVFLTSTNIEQVLLAVPFDKTAWQIANLYLSSTGAELLGPDAPHLAGLSEETTCYISPEYFTEEDPYADFVVHEVAHIFHNCKRATIGLKETRTKVWLLDIDYRKRETFAYACEAYGRILERANGPRDRCRLAEEYRTAVQISDDRVDPGEVAAILQEASLARNGWRVILARCAPGPNRRGAR